MTPSIIHRLRCTNVGEQVADLLFVEQFQCTFGHDGLRDHTHVFNVVLLDDHVFPIHAAENDNQAVFVGEKTVEDSTIDRDKQLFD